MSVIGLEKITERIFAEARGQADEILREADEACADIRAEYEERADEIREDLSADSQLRAKDLIARTKNLILEKQRQEIETRKNALVESVFQSAEQTLLALDAESYTELLAGLLTSAMLDCIRMEEGGENGQAKPFYEAYFAERDGEACRRAVLQKAKKKLSKRIPQESLELLSVSVDSMPITGGVVLKWSGGEMDASFGKVLSELRASLGKEVSQRLFEVRGRNFKI
jgi:vacuolar-type H+-ATPase subunit E/Vma4